MVEAYYFITFLLSVILTIIYVFVYHRHYDVHMSVAFILVPVSALAQLLLSQCESVEAAVVANKFLYVSGCYLILMILFVLLDLCDVPPNRYVRLCLYLITTAVFMCVLQIGRNDLYYKNVSLHREGGASVLVKEYGILHPLYYIMLASFFAIGLSAVIYSYFRKNQVSKHLLILLTVPETFAFVGFFASRILPHMFEDFPNIELVPLEYVLAQVVYLIITHKLALYNVIDTVVESMVQRGDTGFISFDFKFRYLAANETAQNVFPELKQQSVDETIKDVRLRDSLLRWLNNFARDNSCDKNYWKVGEKSYIIYIGYLYDGKKRKRGYQVYITDDTTNQQYIALLDNFNAELKEEVAQKTASIVEMRDNLILGMAIMIESRDNSTGGHIRRTSTGVRILIKEMQRGGEFELSESFCRNIIKAAPMHDLGKIAVDDAILRNPGRFTDEEFEIMKTHADEGAKIVHEILNGTDDDEFQKIAENVAHFHHERWDGMGYPNGLKGEEIPLEARIMAVIDVYDALVSRRVYKERMSFGEADRIIMQSMGQHFDRRLEPYYVAARPKLEEYYSSYSGDVVSHR